MYAVKKGRPGEIRWCTEFYGISDREIFFKKLEKVVLILI